MGYIEELRAIIGHRPLILPGVAVLVIDRQGRVLLQRRSEGIWGVPGGFMELGESAEDTGRREVREETGIEIGNLTLVNVFSGNASQRLANGDEFYGVTIAYVTRDFFGEPKADGIESTDVGFFALSDLPHPMNASFRALLVRTASTYV